MKRLKKIFISRSSDYSGGFGFTLRHFVIYPPSVSLNDTLQVIIFPSYLLKSNSFFISSKLFRSKNRVILLFSVLTHKLVGDYI